MELAVNMPAHDPQVGQAESSMAARSASVIFPLRTAPTASKTVIRSIFFPGSFRVVAGEHGAAADHDGRQVKAGGSHEHARNDLVAIGNQHQGVEGMGRGHDLNAVGDQLPAAQGVFHADVVHGDAVADADGAKDHGGSAGHVHTVPHRFNDLVQVGVPGHHIAGRTGNAHQGAADFGVGVSHGFEECPVGGPVRSLF